MARVEITRIGGNQPFCAAGTAPAQDRAQGFTHPREVIMARFENFAFSLGIALAGVLSLAAVPFA